MATAPQGVMERPRFGPSDRLGAAFRACSRDPTETITRRLEEMVQRFLQHLEDVEGDETTKELAEKCCEQAQEWYYKILDSLISLSGTVDISDICAFWEQDIFQSSLVACCLESSVTSNNLSSHFSQLTHLFNLKPYHFLRMVELVLRLSKDLSPKVRKHLVQVKEKILESLAWTSDSPLWEEIKANESHLPTCQQVMPPAHLEGPTTVDSQPDLPPEEPERSQSAVHEPDRGFLRVFTRMVYRLMSDRLRVICSEVNISDELRQKIWTCFEHSLVYFNSLMKNNHLGMLLMCAVYIMAKVTKREIPFDRITDSYNKLPHNSKDVSENVLISGGVEENLPSVDHNQSSSFLTPNSPSSHHPEPSEQKKLSLNHFYAQIYTSRLQRFAEQFTPTSGADTPLSPYPRQRKTPARKKPVPGFPSISTSLLDPETYSLGGSRLSYTFNSSPTETLREINNLIQTGRPPIKPSCARSLKNIKDEDEEEEEEEGDDGPSTKRIRRDRPTALDQLIWNVIEDRVTERNQDQV